jgi:hypothetical protein
VKRDTIYKYPVKLKTEPYKPKELLKVLRNFYNHLSLISFHPIDDIPGSTVAFTEYEKAVVRWCRLTLFTLKGVKQFKFGVIYMEGTQDENQMYNNGACPEIVLIILKSVKTSEAYEKFLELLGDRVPLQGRTEWSGGLDTKSTFWPFRCLTSAR